MVLIVTLILNFNCALCSVRVIGTRCCGTRGGTIGACAIPVRTTENRVISEGNGSLISGERNGSVILSTTCFPTEDSGSTEGGVVAGLVGLFSGGNRRCMGGLPLRLGNSDVRFASSRGTIGAVGDGSVFGLRDCTATRGYFSTVIRRCNLRGCSGTRTLGVNNVECRLAELLFSVRGPVAVTSSIDSTAITTVGRGGISCTNTSIGTISCHRCTSSALTPRVLNAVEGVGTRRCTRLGSDNCDVASSVNRDKVRSTVRDRLHNAPNRLAVAVSTSNGVSRRIAGGPVRNGAVILAVSGSLRELTRRGLRRAYGRMDVESDTNTIIIRGIAGNRVLTTTACPACSLVSCCDSCSSLTGGSEHPLFGEFTLNACTPNSAFGPVVTYTTLRRNIVNRSAAFHYSNIFRCFSVAFRYLRGHTRKGRGIGHTLRSSYGVFFCGYTSELNVSGVGRCTSVFNLNRGANIRVDRTTNILTNPTDTRGCGGA